MNAYTKVAQAVIRLIAFALALISFFYYAEDAFLYLSKHQPVPAWGWLALQGLPLLIGLVLLLKCRALAEHFTRDLD